MDAREELMSLRRLDELEAKAAAVSGSARSPFDVGTNTLEGLKGLGETALTGITGTLGSIAGLGAGGLEAAFTGDLTKYPETFQKVQQQLTYAPRSDAGQAIQGGINQTLGGWSKNVVDPVAELAAGHPALQTSIKTVGEALPMAASFLRGASKAVTAKPNQLALDVAKDIGYTPRLSQSIDNPTLKPIIARAEDVSAEVAGGASVVNVAQNRNTLALNKRAAAQIGQPGALDLSPPVLARARTKMGESFDAVAKLPGKPIPYGPVAVEAQAIADKEMALQPKQRNQGLIDTANDILNSAKAGEQMSGETYNTMRSRLSETAFDEGGTVGKRYGGLVAALDAAADTQLHAMGYGDLAAGLTAARKQYRNLMVLERGNAVVENNVNPQAVARILKQKAPAEFREGRMPPDSLYDIGVIGDNFKPVREGSQTFGRGIGVGMMGAILQPALWPYVAGALGGSGLGALLTHSPYARAALNPLSRSTLAAGTLPSGQRLLPPP